MTAMQTDATAGTPDRECGAGFVWQIDSAELGLHSNSEPALSWAERVGQFNDQGALRRFVALRPGEALRSSVRVLPLEPLIRIAFVAVDAVAAPRVRVEVSLHLRNGPVDLMSIAGDSLSTQASYEFELPLPQRVGLEGGFAIQIAVVGCSKGESLSSSQRVVGVCEWIVAAADDMARLRGLADYAWRLENERRHFSAVYRDAFFQPSSEAPADAARPDVQAATAVHDDAVGRDSAARVSLLNCLRDIEPGVGEDAFAYALRLLGQVLDATPPDFFARAARLAEQKAGSGRLRILSLCCGSARVEQQMLEHCSAPVELILLDGNADLLQEAVGRMPKRHSIRGLVGDLNEGLPDVGAVDVVLCVSGLHHVVELERVLRQINDRLDVDGEFWSIGEYVGRNGSRLWPREYRTANALFTGFPDRLRRHRFRGTVDPVLPNTDCSASTFEGIRSQELLGLLRQHFQPVEEYVRNCILWRLVDPAYSANFDLGTEEDRLLLCSCVIEEALLWKDGGRSTELHGVYGKRRLLGTGQPKEGAPGSASWDPLRRVQFVCNICGRGNDVALAALSREQDSCTGCGSTVRMRAMIHLLSMALFGRSLPLPDFPEDRSKRGIGLSDWDGYARPLSRKLDYRNTFFHAEPHVDITAPPAEWKGSLDFVIATDVFEHVAPPVGRAFAGAASLLRPGGVLVFSVPYSLDALTVEHFPNLHDFELEQSNGVWTLVNRTRDGRIETYRDLVFHGGPGQTLEMRLFSLNAIRNEASAAGFASVDVLQEPVWEFGIYDPHPWSRPMLIRRG
jgi:SAM-dependent methyltransferase